jgi:predicted nucleic acid-binding protein
MNKRLKIYLDTSVISYLDQQDAIEKMAETKLFWNILKSGKYDIVLSEVVAFEVGKYAEPKRSVLLKYIKEIKYSEIAIDEEIEYLAKKFVDNKILDIKSIDDCRHIAGAIVSDCDIIVSWNFKHIVNYKTIKGVKIAALIEGYKEIIICAPNMLLDAETIK